MKPVLIALWLHLLFFGLALGQTDEMNSDSLSIASQAPDFRVKGWLKGPSITKLNKGTIYVIEFFASWCKPCKASMPKLSILTNQYKKDVSFIAIDIMEDDNYKIEKLQRIIDSMGSRISYPVAYDEGRFMEKKWFLPAHYRSGIPFTIVVDKRGNIAWKGHPSQLEPILRRIVDNDWDLNIELARLKEQRYLDSLETELYYRLTEYNYAWRKDSTDRPTEALSYIDSMLLKEPRLMYRINTCINKFHYLLVIDQKAAIQYGKEVLRNSNPFDLISDLFISEIVRLDSKLNLDSEVLQFGIEAIEHYINSVVYPEINIGSYQYSVKAGWYAKIGDYQNAIQSMQIALTYARGIEKMDAVKLKVLEANLERYQKQQSENPSL